MDIKLILSILAILLNVVGGFSVYLRAIFRGETKPHVYTWLIWTITGIVALLGLMKGQGGWGALPLFLSTIFVFIIFLLSFKYGTKNITKFDTVVLIIALLAVVIWIFMHNPLLAVILVTVADCLGYLPSFRKTWHEPWTESITSWTVYTICGLLMILSLGEYNLLTLTYLVATGIFNLILITICLVRRKKYGKKHKKHKLGFSVIYLILIVVIIIIIANFFLAKSKDDFIKAQMNQYAKQELVIYTDTGSYAKSGDKRYPSLTKFVDLINSADNFGFMDGISVAPPGFFACAVLSSSSNTYCVDNTGYKKESSRQCSLRITAKGHCAD